MDWKDFGRIILVITLGNAIALLWSREAQLWYYVVLCLGGFVAYRAFVWAYDRRIDRLAASEPDVVAEHLSGLSAEERSAARLALGLVSSDDAVVDAVEGERFDLPRTSRSLRIAMTWFCAGLAGVLLVAELAGSVRSSSSVGTLVAAGCFLLGAVFFDQLKRWEGGTLLVTNSGVVQIKPSGDRVGMLWSEVAVMRHRRMMMRVELWSADGRRRVSASYTMEGFARWMELVLAHLQWIDERAR